MVATNKKVHGIREYWNRVNSMAEKYGITKKEAREHITNGTVPGSMKTLDSDSNVVTLSGPEAAVANAKEQVSRLDNEITQKKEELDSLITQRDMWEKIANSLN